MLAKVAELTGDQSLHANVQLVRSNAIVAAHIAVAYVQQKQPTPAHP